MTWESMTVLTAETAGWRRQETSTGWGRVTISYHLDGCHHLKPTATVLDPDESVQDGVEWDRSAPRWTDQERRRRICKACARRWAKARGPEEVARVAEMLPVEHAEPPSPELVAFLGHWARRPLA